MKYRQRAALILTDEPTAALDTKRGSKVMAMPHEIAREHPSAVVAATHDHEMIPGLDTVSTATTCDWRLARMNHHAQASGPRTRADALCSRQKRA